VTWSSAIGFSVYYFEGIGVILPISEITAKPDEYYKIVIAVISTTAVLSLIFGNYCCVAWGDNLKSPIITDSIIDENVLFPQWPSCLICFLFCFNLIFSYPLVIYPTIMINENYLFDGWPKSKLRQ
jgi:hypothetical protein